MYGGSSCSPIEYTVAIRIVPLMIFFISCSSFDIFSYT